MRILLFIIAILVIVYFVWEDQKRRKKVNRYVEKPEKNAQLGLDYGIEYDIEHEIGANSKTDYNFNQSSQRKQEYTKFSPEFSTSLDNEDVVSKKEDFNPHVKNTFEHQAEEDSDFIDDPDFDFDREYNSRQDADIVMKNIQAKEEMDDFDPFEESEFTTQRATSTQTSAQASAQEPAQPSTQPPSLPGQISEPATTDNYNVGSSHKQPIKRVFSIYIRSKNKSNLNGDELLQALLSIGCRFGEMNIFHRHEKASGQGRIMFSVASMVNPGTFNIDNMQEFKTPGILLFFTYPGHYAPTVVYDLLLKSAYKLAKYLDAEILDDEKEPLTSQKVSETQETLEILEAEEFFG